MGMHKQKQIKYDFPETLAGAILESLKNGKEIEVFGNDYETKDGSCERDFIHVDDLISGHMSSIRFIEKNDGFHIFNLGTGKSSSVLEVIEEFKKITNSNINIAIGKRRNGDISISYANISKAKKDLNWKPIYNLNDMCKDSLIGA
jgi:UDP-glucose 4-epimerase